MNFEQLQKLALDCGFTHVGRLNVDAIQLKDDVRAMCAANQCGQYGTNWSCPPACGSLEACRERLKDYSEGILVQTVGEMEDSFDYEGMMEIEARHKAQFLELHDRLLKLCDQVLPLGVGCCSRCKKCTCPDEPCRMPEKHVSSMEAYGMLVMQVCKDSGVGYYYGPDHLAYTSCFLFGKA